MSAYCRFSDHKLMTLLKESDHAAFAEIYNRFFGLLYVHAFRRLNDEDEANDLIQEMFASLWDKRETFAINGNLSAYLYASVRNRVLNIIEHKKVSDKYMESLAGYTDLDYQFADHKIRENQLRNQIEKEINALPAQMRRVFIMSRTENLSYKEIAKSMDMTEQAIKSNIKRTLRQLRLKLGLLTVLAFLINFF